MTSLRTIIVCPRCLECHENLTFQDLRRPIYYPPLSGVPIATCWAMCPTTNEPILGPKKEKNEHD